MQEMLQHVQHVQVDITQIQETVLEQQLVQYVQKEAHVMEKHLQHVHQEHIQIQQENQAVQHVLLDIIQIQEIVPVLQRVLYAQQEVHVMEK